MRRVLLAFAGIILTGGLVAQTAAPANDYIPIIRTLAHGKAPKMRAQLLTDKPGERTYAVVFGTGDEVLAGLTEFAENEHLGAARITGIGALQSATLGWLDLDRKAYHAIRVPEQVEVTSMVGDIAQYNRKPAVHVHMNLSHKDGTVTGGHLLEAFVRPTLEVMITEYPHTMQKQLDPETGMTLIRPSGLTTPEK
jgi:predicted DNA-binding protein with PD1-like motif